MIAPAAQLWFGRTSHVREHPFRRAFTHRIAMLEIDIGRLEEAEHLSRLFSTERRAPVAFRAADYGARSPGASLRGWAEERYAQSGIGLDGGAIRLLTFPRVLGYGFAPISIWFGYGPDGGLRGLIYEVHNTFGETHSYVSSFNPDRVRETAEKEFHVSPFFDVSGEYRFTLRSGKRKMALAIENFGAEGRTHLASLTLRPTALTTPALLRWLVAMPISGLGVMLAIHWQAMRLVLKGARYRDKPKQRAKRTTLALPEETSAGAPENQRKRA
jgi:DUF1365 family protein